MQPSTVETTAMPLTQLDNYSIKNSYKQHNSQINTNMKIIP